MFAVRGDRRGELFVSPDAVVFIAGNARFEHTEGDITMTKARLRPPWSNTFLMLQHQKQSMRVGLSGFGWRRLRRALHRSGLTVREQSSSGPPPLPKRSRAGRIA